MIIPDVLTSQLEKLITILDNCCLILSKDKFRYNEDQIDLVNLIKLEFEELKNIKIDTFLANVKNSNLEKSILNGFNKKLSDYIKMYESKFHQIKKFSKSILKEKILSKYQFDEKIKILEDDITDIENERNKMFDWLKEKECDLIRIELENIKSIRKKSFDKLSYIKKDYYSSIFLTCLEIEKKINDYFPDDQLELQDDIVKLSLVANIYEVLLKEKIIEPGKLSLEDYFLIVNMRMPKNNCRNSVKKLELMGFPIKIISKSIKKLSISKFDYFDFVADKLRLNAHTINNKAYMNEKFEIFYPIFNLKVDTINNEK